MGSVGGEDSEQGKVAYASIMMPEEHKKKMIRRRRVYKTLHFRRAKCNFVLRSSSMMMTRWVH